MAPWDAVDDFGGEDDVVAAAQEGSQAALTELYRAIQPALVAYLRSRVPGSEEDLASDIWIEAARGLASFEGDRDDFRRFVFTIAHRRIIDQARKHQRRRTDPVDLSSLSLLGTADTEGDALEQMDGNRAVARIRELLPADQAEVVLLRVVAGLSLAEVAEIMGRRPAAVSLLQHRALRRLARQLDRDGRELG